MTTKKRFHFHDSPTAIETYTRKFDVEKPRVEDIHPLDIAHSLSLICRYGGHCKRFYSVAEHCIYCYDEAVRRNYPSGVRLMCLLHDGCEAYISDLGRPIKEAEGMAGYNQMEDRIQEYVYERFSTEIGQIRRSILWRAAIKEIDNASLAYEVPRLMRTKGKNWLDLNRIKPVEVKWYRWLWYRIPGRAKAGFIYRLKLHGIEV